MRNRVANWRIKVIGMVFSAIMSKSYKELLVVSVCNVENCDL